MKNIAKLRMSQFFIWGVEGALLPLLAMLAFPVHAEVADISPIEVKSGKVKESAGINLDAAINEDTYFESIPNVLTVSRLSQPIADAPSAVTVIDKEMIRAAGIIDLPEIFRLVPGFYVAINAGFVQNSNYVVSYHGMTSAYPGNMQVLIDGRSVYEPLFGGVQWSELPVAIQDIERIEVTRGPNAASYGANSFLGVINIITQNPNDAQGNRVSLSAANGRNEEFYRYGGKSEDFSYRVTLGRREDSGLNNREDYKRTNMLSARANYQINSRDELEFQFGAANGVREEGISSPLRGAPFGFPHTKDIDNHFELVKWHRSFNSNNDLQLQAYHSVSSSDEVYLSGNLSGYSFPFGGITYKALYPYQIVDTSVKTERYDLELQHTYAFSDALRVVWGGNIRQDKTTAPARLGTNDALDFNLQRVFGHMEWRPYKNLLVNTGAMVEHNDFTGTDISPRGSVNIKISPNQTLRFGVSAATRTPNLLEEKFNARIIIPSNQPNVNFAYLQYIDGGNLNPETIVSREIGYLGEFGHLSLDARVFHDTINQLITSLQMNVALPAGYIPVSKPRNFVNGGSLVSEGVEVQAKWKVTPQTLLIGNYAYVNIDANNNNAIESKFETSMPTNTISAMLNHRFNDDWDASLAYYQVGAVEALGDGSPEFISRRWDTRFARKFSSGRWRGEVSCAVQNLLNDHYHEFADYNTMRRRAYVNLTLDF